MSADDPLAVQDWSAYEKFMLEVLREERRRKLGLPPDAHVPASLESRPCGTPGSAAVLASQVSSPDDGAPAQPGPVLLPAEPSQYPEIEQPSPQMRDDGQVPEPVTALSTEEAPSDAEPQQAVAMQIRDHARPPNPVWMPSAQTIRGRRLHAASLAVLLVAVAAAGVTAIVKSYRSSKPSSPPTAAAKIQQAVLAQTVASPAPAPAIAPTIVTGSAGSEVDPEQHDYTVSGDHVRLRSAPSLTASIVGTYRRGALVKLKERPASGDWCLIRAGEGNEGWMMCRFLKEIAAAATGPAPLARIAQ